LTTGAPVRVDGVEVGNVEKITIVPHNSGKPADKNKNIEVVMRIDQQYQKYILTDSVATLVTEGLLGNRYVNITRGITGVEVQPGKEIPGSQKRPLRKSLNAAPTC